MSVAYQELTGSPEIRYGLGRSTSATRKFKVAWADVFLFAREMYGRYRDIAGGGGWREPARFPNEELKYLRVVDVAVKPYVTKGVTTAINETGEYAVWEYAEVMVTYGVLIYGSDDVTSETIVEENIRIGGEMIALPWKAFKWTGGVDLTETDDIHPGKVMPFGEFTITRYHVSSLPDTTIMAESGKVNAGTWRGYAAGKVLFQGADASRSITTEGVEDWKVIYSFLIKDIEWNKFYKREVGFTQIEDKTTGDKVYTTATITSGVWVALGI